MRILRSLFAICTIFVLVHSTLFAQASPVTGRIVDPQGASVANAEISLVPSAASQRTRTTRSNAEGSFSLDSVTPGQYTLLVRAPGFTESSQSITVGAATNVNVKMDIAGVVEDVTVQGALLGTAATGKTNLPVRDMPMTIHTVPNQVIEEQGANDLVAALQNVPGVYAFTNYGIYEGYTFRGFLDLFPSLANQLLDGVRHEGNRINTQLANIDRVEVLKGPSSALYGGGAIGATVNLIRKKPSAQPSYDATFAGGSWTTGRAQFGATGPLASERTLYRFDFGAETKEGYRHNETRRLQMTPSLAWRLGTSDQINVYYTFSRDKFAGDAGIPLVLPGEGPVENFFPDVPRDRNYRTPVDAATSYDNSLQVGYARQINNSWGFRNTFSYRPVNDEYFLAEFLFVEDDARTVFRDFLQFKHHRRPMTNLAEVTARLKAGVEQNLVFGWEGQHYTNHSDTVGDIGVVEATSIDLFDPVETRGRWTNR